LAAVMLTAILSLFTALHGGSVGAWRAGRVTQQDRGCRGGQHANQIRRFADRE